jgi:hypothetical protein
VERRAAGGRGTGNTPDCVAQVIQAAAPSVLAVGGVVVPADGVWEDAAPYHGCRGTTFEGKWTPDVLAPAENLVLPSLDHPSGYERPDHLDAEVVRPHLSDRNRCVRAAALRAVRAAPAVWEPLLPDVERRLADASPDLCQAAAELTGEMRATGGVPAAARVASRRAALRRSLVPRARGGGGALARVQRRAAMTGASVSGVCSLSGRRAKTVQ